MKELSIILTVFSIFLGAYQLLSKECPTQRLSKELYSKWYYAIQISTYLLSLAYYYFIVLHLEWHIFNVITIAISLMVYYYSRNYAKKLYKHRDSI